MKRNRRLVLLALCLACRWAVGQEGGDLQAQILYSFYAEDTNGLASLVQLLTTEEQANGADSTLHYHLAHAQYRLGILAAQGHGGNAIAAFDGCITELRPLVEQDVKSAEALALQSACYSRLARLRKFDALLLRAHADDRMDRALALAPQNPRIALLRAQETLGHAKSASLDSMSAVAELQLAAQIFEQSTATSVGEPGWGHAETYLELGRMLQARGDILGARNWIEKALIVAPDFKAAQRQLATLVRR